MPEKTHLPNPQTLKIFISTGEVSGDLQGGLLIEALFSHAKQTGIELEIVGLGGERMANAGCHLLRDTTAIGSVGLLESIPFILPTLEVQKKAKKYLQENPPDVVVLIDYMGPNIALGEYVKGNLPGVPVVFYIAPQLWVWAPFPSQTRQIVKISDLILAVFPQEASYYKEKGANVCWVGHPLIDRLGQFPTRQEARKVLGIEEGELAVALLPASRQQEVKYLWPVILEAARLLQERVPGVSFWVPLSLEKYRGAIEEGIRACGLRAKVVAGRSWEVLAAADLAISKSGTVNLEIALLKVPMVVVYRVSGLTYGVARRLFKFKIPFMSPVNLVGMKSVVPELLQEEATPEAIVDEALRLLPGGEGYEEVLGGYEEMRELLGPVGVCERAAVEVLGLVVRG
ncbi:lipid-A-disaccharide synthase [Ancylothrix sp. C2]|uniref:lipid-A-disaccharide synthase n=1 Tax=Ancylothrix sp. D3o TaxID=2953691 RepID=UPI0021BA8C0F|nr:lipid-A-disaccharide synthase [Ancylothrix sp. D3o]MCT7948451.1 lipid-A-disaccharide synthase [Ancylothrix sp. D3o]